MKNRNAYMAIVAAMMLCGFGVTACDSTHWITAKQQAEETEKEFVCYDDGALVERHVSVKRVRAYRYSRAVWLIHYKDGQKAHYVQPPGETCQVETITQP